MKIWKKTIIKNNNKQVKLISNSLTNYIYKYGPISNIATKYKIKDEDIKKLNQYTSNRIAGLILLFMAKDINRINDIANKYNNGDFNNIIPEIEAYIEK